MSAPILGIETGNSWSTEEQEDELLNWLDQHVNADVSTLGVTRQGRHIRMVTFGDLTKPTMLLLGGVHGNEPSGRERMLWLAREMADKHLHHRALQVGAVAIVPNVNPDGRAVSSRENSVGVDPNRDHIMQAEVEAQSVQSAIRDLNVVFIYDLHEYGSTDGEVWTGGPVRDDVHPELGAHSEAAQVAFLESARGDGYIADYYPFVPRRTVQGVSSMQNVLGIFSEVRSSWSRTQRFEAQGPMLQAMISYYTNNVSGLWHAHNASKAHTLKRPGPELLQVWSNIAPPGSGMALPLTGYVLSEPIPQKYIDAHGIDATSTEVSIKQQARGIIPELIDPAVEDAVAPARRIMAPEIPLTAPTSASVKIGGSSHSVVQMIHQDGDSRRSVQIARRTERESALVPNGLFSAGLEGWYEYGTTDGTYQAVANQRGKPTAVHMLGDGLVRLESVLNLDHDDVRINLAAEVWVANDGDRPGQIQLVNLEDGSLINTPINPASGELRAGWNDVYGISQLGNQGRTQFGIRVAQVISSHLNEAYWRITEARIW